MRTRTRVVLLCGLLLALSGRGWAQETPSATPSPPPYVVSAHRATFVRRGPGDTFVPVARLNPGVPARIIQRNHTGNWLRLIRTDVDGEVIMDGWVMSGYLNLDPALRFSEVPVNTVVRDADPSTVRFPSLARLYSAPVMPPVSAVMRDMYLVGLALGHRSTAVTKVGDSMTADPYYLSIMSDSRRELGPYDYLADTVAYFGVSAAQESAAARLGMTSLTLFDSMWADPALCEPGETPLACEYQRKLPSVAFILFGPNDVKHMTDQEFAAQMRRIVDETLARGIIPVLSTFSYDPDSELWWQSVNFNLRLVEIADEYEIPLINLWAAARSLPDYGLDIDNVHMTHSGFTYLKFDTGHESWYGVSLRNLLSIRMLDEIRRTMRMN